MNVIDQDSTRYRQLGLAVAHLNAPVGELLTREQLASVLRGGSLNSLEDAPSAVALLSYLFVELEPQLIAACALESGSDLRLANQLYEDIVSRAMPRVAAWERAVAHLA